MVKLSDYYEKTQEALDKAKAQVTDAGTGAAQQAGELIPSATLVNVIVDFTSALTEITLFPYQEAFARRIVRSVIEEDMAEVTGLFSRQSGKTETLGWVSAGLMALLPALAKALPNDPRLTKFNRGFWVGIYAPIDEQALICFSRVAERLTCDSASAILAHPDINASVVRCSGGRIVLESGSYCRAKTASPRAHIEGWTYHLIITDESQDLDKEIVQKSIHPMGAFTGATMCKIGTPENARSEFYDAILRNVALDRQQGDPALRCHYEYDYTICSKYNERYKKYCVKEIERLGAFSMAFRLKYKLEWAFDVDLAFSSATLNRVQDRTRGFLHSWSRGPTVAGWDVAKERNKSVVWVIAPDLSKPAPTFGLRPEKKGGATEREEREVICYHKAYVGCLEMEGTNYEKQYELVSNFCLRMGVKRLVIDQTGAGNPIPERMDILLPSVEVIGVSWNSVVAKSFCNTFYYQEMEAGRCSFPANEATQRDHKFGRWMQEHKDVVKVWSGNYMLITKPDDNAEDDHVDACALAAWGTKDPLDVGIAEVMMGDVFSRSFSQPSGDGNFSRHQPSIFDVAQAEAFGQQAGRASRYRRTRRR